MAAHTRCSSQHHATTDDSPGFLVWLHRCIVRVGSGTRPTSCCSLKNGCRGGSGGLHLYVGLDARNAGASQFGNDEGQTPHSQCDFHPPTPIVSATCAVISVPKTSLDVWNWRRVGGGVGGEGMELCRMDIHGRGRKLVPHDIRASRGRLITRCVPTRDGGGSRRDLRGRVIRNDTRDYR